MVRDVCVETAKNAAMAVPVIRARRLRRPRTSGQVAGRDAWLERYAFQALRTMQAVGETPAGRRIVEIGPGDYLSSGLALLAAGAAAYTAIDRFPGNYSSPAAKASYRAIRAGWHERFPDLAWPPELDPERFPEALGGRVLTVAAPIEDFRPADRYDVVCSFQVGEHVEDVRGFAVKTRELTAPGGVGIHRVDFGPHGPWVKYSDPFTFLRPSERVWRWMGSERGLPNRRRAHEFAEAFAAAGLEAHEAQRELFPAPPSEPARLARRFRGMPIDSLQVRAITYVCRPV